MSKSAKAAASALKGETSTAVATVGTSAGALALPAGVKVKRVLTVPSLVIKETGQVEIVQFVSAIRISKVVDKSPQKREPAKIADVVKVETGEMFILLLPAVVQQNIERDYPGVNENGTPEYVGRAFYIENMGKRKDGQRYNDFKIIEVEPETDAE